MIYICRDFSFMFMPEKVAYCRPIQTRWWEYCECMLCTRQLNELADAKFKWKRLKCVRVRLTSPLNAPSKSTVPRNRSKGSRFGTTNKPIHVHQSHHSNRNTQKLQAAKTRHTRHDYKWERQRKIWINTNSWDKVTMLAFAKRNASTSRRSQTMTS